MRHSGLPAALMAIVVASGLVAQTPTDTAWTYQGRLIDGAAPADGHYDLEAQLWDDPSAGSQVGAILTLDDVVCTDGYFSVELDFGGVFDGEARWLQLALRPGDSIGPFTPLAPRTRIAPAPHSIYAASAGVSASSPWSGLAGVPTGFADDIDDAGVTSVIAGTGLSGGGSSSAVTLSADTSVLQARVSSGCSAGSSIRAISDTGAVTCESDDVGSGDITAVNTSSGILGGVTSGAADLIADSSYLQRRVTSTCPAGSAVRSIGETGNVVCQGVDPARSYFVNVGAPAFAPPASHLGTYYANYSHGACLAAAVTAPILASAPLPHGASISTLYAHVLDMLPGDDLAIRLVATDVASGDDQTLVAMTNNGTGFQTIGTSLDHSVDHTKFAYTIEVQPTSGHWLSGECQQEILAVGIEYTY